MSATRLNQYKSKALDNTELRKRREEEGIQIRKAKREEQVCLNLNLPAIFNPTSFSCFHWLKNITFLLKV